MPRMQVGLALVLIAAAVLAGSVVFDIGEIGTRAPELVATADAAARRGDDFTEGTSVSGGGSSAAGGAASAAGAGRAGAAGGSNAAVAASPSAGASVGAAGAAAEAARYGNLKAGVFSPARVAPDFSLQGSDGTELKLSRYRGKVVLLGFGYTSCTEVCPVTLAILAQARRELGTLGENLQVVYLTVDPERDDPGRMRKFLANFDPTFIGGSGTPQQLAAVRKDYGITAVKKPIDGDYAVAHSSFIYLIDRDGKLRAMMPFGHSAEDYAHDVRILLSN